MRMVMNPFVALAGRDWADLGSEHPCQMAMRRILLSFGALRYSVGTDSNQLFEAARNPWAGTGIGGTL